MSSNIPYTTVCTLTSIFPILNLNYTGLNNNSYTTHSHSMKEQIREKSVITISYMTCLRTMKFEMLV